MIFRRIGRSRTKDVKIMGKLFPAAEEAARADGLDSAGAEYLLVAAMDLEDGSARRAFERAGLDPDGLRAAIRSQHAEALRRVGARGVDDDVLDGYLPEPTPVAGPVRTSPSAHRMFRAVLQRVKRDRSQLHSAYFVLVAAQTDQGTVARTLRHLGADRGALAAAAQREVDDLNAAPN